MPHLKELLIDFSTSTPRPNTEGELMQTPIPVVSLPALKQLKFHGIAAYLDSLVSRISAPVLERLMITLFTQGPFTFHHPPFLMSVAAELSGLTLPHLSQFMSTAEELRHPAFSIFFNREAVSIAIRHHELPFEDVFNLRIRCRRFDWQIKFAAQVCGTLLPVLSVVEDLTLDSYEYFSQFGRQDAVTSSVWRDLILPFKNVTKLNISHVLWSELSTALHHDDEGPESFLHQLLPKLQITEIKPGIQHLLNDPIAQFSNAHPLGRVVVPTSRRRLGTIDRSGSIISLPDGNEDSTSKAPSMGRNWLQRTIRVVNRVQNLKRFVPRFPTGS